ncbi:nuclease-related domain-containing protein [Lysinibacillus sp. G4S2]|uniref:nuclease-related domain-containing protein n=1 Tax=Lysinibacillus sp. G4S2 TaxID=3055859 RepID=UPI0025A2D962|nr:nuclease-related domain-containing protein [Lysinibacillus sp. G4S2]MDM5246415.1 nuclease-related domain-containing protein [Lysinibacillus sp. G4S2]
MNIAIREKPIKLMWLEALKRRLTEKDIDFSYYNEQFRRVDAGFAGESRVDREWLELICPYTFFVLHNLNLMNSAQHSHQLDTLFICTNFMLVVEIKNINGRLDFDDITHQCIRTKPDGTVEGFPNAISQTQRHMQFLKVISQNYSLPIEGAVIIANPNAIIASHPNTIPIFHVSGLQKHLHSLFKKYSQATLSDKQLTQLAQHLLSKHQPLKIPAPIDPSRFRHGVLCPKCQYKFKMHYVRGFWICSRCHYASEEIFAEALQDYRYLVRPTITNKQLREFFNIHSSDAANRLLRKFQFPFSGSYKNRVYHLPENLVEYMKPFFRSS